jgi:hypothetical protein
MLWARDRIERQFCTGDYEENSSKRAAMKAGLLYMIFGVSNSVRLL